MPIFFRDVENGRTSLFNFFLSLDSCVMHHKLCIICHAGLKDRLYDNLSSIGIIYAWSKLSTQKSVINWSFGENSWVKSPYVKTIPSIAIYIIVAHHIIASIDKHPNSYFEIHFSIEISLRICLSFCRQKLIWNQHLDAGKVFSLRFVFPLKIVLNNWFKCRMCSSQIQKSCSIDGEFYIVLITDFSSFFNAKQYSFDELAYEWHQYDNASS